jgi:glycerol-3-phosphate dehydrogenase
MDRPTPLASRERRLEALFGERFDVLVVGGGATGAATALDLAVRGARVALVERGDWGQETSSASSRLLHGGLRYLEQFEFGLVRESCLERALLLRNAAGLAWPRSRSSAAIASGA